MSTDPSLDGSLGYWLHRLDGAMRVKFEQRLAPHGVTPSEWSILTLCFQKCVCPADLARSLGQKPPLVTRWLQSLEKKGLVERTADPVDRRFWKVRLSPSGEHLVPSLRAISKGVNEETLEILEPADRERFLRLLKMVTLPLITKPTRRPELPEDN